MNRTVVKKRQEAELWEKAQAAGMSRRQFLILLASSGAAAVLAACTSKLPSMPSSTTPSIGDLPANSPVFEAIQFFDRRQAALVHAAAGRIIPGTARDPGAKEAGVVVYIDRALDGFERALQRNYVVGLEGMESYAQARYTQSFVDLTDQQQDDILTNMDKNTDEAKKYMPDPRGFFGTLLTHVRQGMFGDPIYGGNRNSVGWKLVGHSGVVFDHKPAVMACNVNFPKEYMGDQQYYATHVS